MPVTVLNPYGRRIPTRPLAKAARAALSLEGEPRADVSIVLTDDSTIRQLNRDYRRVDEPTDVLSFSQQDYRSLPIPPGMEQLLGDVVVSVETAERQAKQHGHSLEAELSLLVIHGILHLLGHDDETESGAALMRDKERAALQMIGAQSAGLVARTLE